MSGPSRCPACHEPITEGTQTHRCDGSILARTSSGEERAISGSRPTFAETIVYQVDRTMTESDDNIVIGNDDGFPPIDDLIGSTLSQYRIESLAGRGSMGRVYQAYHLGLHRPCAIKVMNPGLLARQPQIRERFWAEARAVANLLHPHVVTIHNLGSDRGYHFIEMEFVPGGISLRESLIRDGAFEPIRASTLVRQVVLALGAAHQAGLVHRDVKPANVLLTSAGDAKLADFGLVRRISDAELAGASVAGTPTFMAPELFEGAAASRRSDIYAVGVMYYYLLSERLPFSSDQMVQLIQMHRQAAVPDIREIAPGVPDIVAAILDRCLAKQPEQRYESAEELADDLQSAIYHLRETESLVRESVEGLDCFVQGARDHYRILFPLPGDRLQEVYVEEVQGREGERLLSVFSVCAPAESRYFSYALRLNNRLTYGSLSIRNVNGQPMFVMTRTFARNHVCALDIRAALVEIAHRSDRIEQQLTDTDLY